MAWPFPPADRLDVRLRHLSAIPRNSVPDYGLLDVTRNVQPTRAAFLCGYSLLPYLFPTKITKRHTVLSWYTYSGAPPSCNSCSVLTAMRKPIVARHNKTREWISITRVLLLLLLLLTAIELSLGGISPYTSREKNTNKYI